MEVVLSHEYEKQLSARLEELINSTINNRLEREEPRKKRLNRQELKAHLAVGDKYIDTLMEHGLAMIKVPGSRQIHFDLDEVYKVMDKFKVYY